MQFHARRGALAAVSVLIFILAIGCVSESPLAGRVFALRGMVYNENRMPVLDVTVSVMDGSTSKESSMTDLHGRYVLPDVPFGRITLRFTKVGYEPFIWTFSFTHPTQVVYVRMSNIEELLDDLASSIKNREWSQANAFLGRLRKLQPTNSVADYLQGLMLVRRGNSTQAAELLEKLSKEKDPVFAVELTLADLYQYKLHEPQKALLHLKKAITIQNDVDLENRIVALEKSK